MTTLAPKRDDAETLLTYMAEHLPEFVLGQGWFKMKDEHDPGVAAKPLPTLPYAWAYLEELATQQYVITPKSRQMTVTWLTLGFLLGWALTRVNQLIVVQTKREDDALNLIGRTKFLYDHLPNWLRVLRPRVKAPKDTVNALELPGTGTKIWGLPQGADVIRSNTVSVYYGDELDFQPEAAASIRAVMPSIIGGGRFIGTSTPELGGVMESLINGTEARR